MATVTIEMAEPCQCCCPDGFACYQTWTASWSCADQAWTGPTAGAKACMATSTSTAWVKTAGDTDGCSYRKYVRMPKCCTVNGDCSGEANTATPAMPFGGDPPTDCCTAALDCTLCPGTPPRTPRTWTVTFDGVGTSLFKCDNECTFGGGVTSDGAPLGTYELAQDADNPCRWFFVGIGPEIDLYGGDSMCLAAPTVRDNTLLIELTLTAGGYHLHASSPHVGLVGEFGYFDADNDLSDDPGCCTGKTFTNDRTYDCGTAGDGGIAVATPHC